MFKSCFKIIAAKQYISQLIQSWVSFFGIVAYPRTFQGSCFNTYDPHTFQWIMGFSSSKLEDQISVGPKPKTKMSYCKRKKKCTTNPEKESE